MEQAHPRPTSPHLTIYRWQISMVLSITHRATGVALYAGSALLVAWLWAAAYDAQAYKMIYGFMQAWYGRVLLIGWTLSFYFHLGNGIRHMWWDTGNGLDVPSVIITGWLAVGFTLLLTGVTWWLVFNPIG